jgi:rare lipoprotein A
MRSFVIVMSTFGLLVSSPALARHHPPHPRSSYSHHHPHHTSRRHTHSRRYFHRSNYSTLDGSCRTAARLGGPCGCYASELIFGHTVRGLWKASAWYRFQRTSPAVGMAAVRQHHVVIIGAINGDGTFLGRDSWGLTRRPLRGWTFVNPHDGNGWRAFASIDNQWAQRPEEYANDNNPHLTTASWYNKPQRTASGEWFEPNGMTAASRSLPFGTRLRVRYRGRSVVVRVSDRGPFVRGRGLDLSRGAARALKMPGVARVSWTRL